MEEGRFNGGIAALVWDPREEKYLLLKRSELKDFAGGVWECVTGRVKQGESFEEAAQREVFEEVGIPVALEFLVGTTHFYRGEETPENELLGVVYACSARETDGLRLSEEHSEYCWATAVQAQDLLKADDPSTHWTRRAIERAEALRHLLPPALLDYQRSQGMDLN